MNPSINPLGATIRMALSDAIEAAPLAITEVLTGRVMRTGTGRNFIAHANPREFDGSALEPHLPDIIARLTIAAIKGPALGGGFGVALACRVHIAAPKTLVDLPDPVPGGGMQRLPRLSTGRALHASETSAIGMIEECTENPLAAALVVDPQRLSQPPLDEGAAPDVVAAAHAMLKPICGDSRHHSPRPTRRRQHPFSPSARRGRRSGQHFLSFVSIRKHARCAMFLVERSADIATLLAAPITMTLVTGGKTMDAPIARHRAGFAVTMRESDEAAENGARANLRALCDEAATGGKLAEARGGLCQRTAAHRPLPVLERLVAKGRSFADLHRTGL